MTHLLMNQVISKFLKIIHYNILCESVVDLLLSYQSYQSLYQIDAITNQFPFKTYQFQDALCFLKCFTFKLSVFGIFLTPRN